MPFGNNTGRERTLLLKRYITVVNLVAHRHAVDVHSADYGFWCKLGIVINTAFNRAVEYVLNHPAGHVVHFNTGINGIGRNKLETQPVGERIRIYL